MTKILQWYLLILTGLTIMLAGLVWDAVIHATEHAHLVVEALFDPGNPFENPAHLLIAAGLLWALIVTLLGFTRGWLEGKNWRVQPQSLSVPLALWLGMGAAGVVALAVLAQTP